MCEIAGEWSLGFGSRPEILDEILYHGGLAGILTAMQDAYNKRRFVMLYRLNDFHSSPSIRAVHSFRHRFPMSPRIQAKTHPSFGQLGIWESGEHVDTPTRTLYGTNISYNVAGLCWTRVYVKASSCTCICSMCIHKSGRIKLIWHLADVCVQAYGTHPPCIDRSCEGERVCRFAWKLQQQKPTLEQNWALKLGLASRCLDAFWRLTGLVVVRALSGAYRHKWYKNI